MQLGGEHEIWIHRLRFPHPEFGQMWLDVSVERRVDLHHVEAARQNLKGMLFPVLHSGRIEDSFPVFVRPAGGANADWGGYVHGTSSLDASRLAQASAQSGKALRSTTQSKRSATYDEMGRARVYSCRLAVENWPCLAPEVRCSHLMQQTPEAKAPKTCAVSGTAEAVPFPDLKIARPT